MLLFHTPFCMWYYYRPVNLIHETKDRWVYALAFGALTGQFLYIILDGGIVESTSSVGNIWRGTVISVWCNYAYNQLTVWLVCHRNIVDIYHDVLSVVKFCSVCINTWNNADCFSHYWTRVYFASVSHQPTTHIQLITMYEGVC